MNEKRFVSEDDCYGYYTEIIDNEKELDLSLPNPKKNLTIEELVELLNNLNGENEQLRKENKKLNCIIEQLEAKYEDKGFSLAYDMGECE